VEAVGLDGQHMRRSESYKIVCLSAFDGDIYIILGKLPHSDEHYSRKLAPTFRHADLSDNEFLRHWSEGKPIVVTDVKQQGEWGPEYFISRYRTTPVVVEDCETGRSWKSTVADFFDQFLKHDERTIWKLKVSLLSFWTYIS
jgi:hypothetical protein